LSVTDWGTPTDIAIAAGAGIALGAAAGVLARKHQNDAKATPEIKP